MTHKSGLPAYDSTKSTVEARRSSVTNDLRRIIVSIVRDVESTCTPLEVYKPIFDGLAEAEKYLERGELLRTWDTINDTVLNSGGEPHEIETPPGYWPTMAIAARMMFWFN